MGRREQMVEKVMGLMKDKESIRNMGIAAHIDHGKTTLSDNLLSGCGIISEELSGKQCFMDYDEQEQARGITINAANVSMVHKYDNKDYLVNMIDTPGHVDFSGDVTRAMRAVDGAIIVVCAVEGVMPQTKTVINQALKEKVKPLIFINKVDRMINELKLTPEAMQERFMKIIKEVNALIVQMAPEEFKKDWVCDVMAGKVAFGSAYNNWATSVPFMKKAGISFKDIIDYCNQENQKELAKKTPLHAVLLDMVVRHLPDPLTAQKYRVPNIWHGDDSSPIGKSMAACDDNGKLAMMVTKIIIDPQAGEIATGRIFSGSLKRGMEVYSNGTKQKMRVQQLGVYMGPDRINVDGTDSGNIAAIVGLKDTFAGDTLSEELMTPFESIKHFSEPVVTKAIEPKNPADLPKLIEVMRSLAKADPTLRVTIDEETGEYLIAGMGELHLEIVEYRIRNERGVDIKSSNPIVVYRETVTKPSPEEHGRSPNKHNDFFLSVESMPDALFQAIVEGKFSEGRRKDSKDIWQELNELGMDKDQSKKVRDIFQGNMFVDCTKGIQGLDEVMELTLDSFEQVMKRGPLSQEPCTKVMVKLLDVKLHEDAVHRGPAQIYPAVRNPIYRGMLEAGPGLLEPKQKVFIQTPSKYMGDASRDIQSRRGIIEDMRQEGEQSFVDGKVPVAEMFGFAGDIRSATEGNVLWSTENAGFENVPKELQNEQIGNIRKRKGLDPRPPSSGDYAD
jgi:elongation factor 2